MTRTGLLVALLVVGGPLQATARVLHVRPGDSIQAAVDAARSGDIVMIAPGTYHEAGRPCPTEPANTCAVVVDKDNITLMGQSARAGAVVLENSGGQDQGIAIAKQGADGATCFADPSQRIRGARVHGLTVNGFGGDGIFLFCVDDWGVEHGLTDVEAASVEHTSTPFVLSIEDAIYDLIELLDS